MSAGPEQVAPDARVAAPTRREVSRLLGWHAVPLAVVAPVVILAALIPFATTDSYLINLLILIFIYAVLNQAWNLTLGMTGAWNFGQLALFAIGGYAAGIAEIEFGVSPWIALVIGAVAAGVANVILSLPSMRLRGIYVALLTFSFAEVVRLAVINDSSGVTGGVYGLSGIVSPFESLSTITEQRVFYWFALIVCIVTALIIQRVMNSPYGVAFQGLRDSSRYASGLGVSMRVYYVAATTLSAVLSGVAGALYAFHYSSISPTVMGLTPLSLLVLMIIVGGMGTVSGPIVGTIVVMILTELLRGTDEWRMFILGVVLLLILVLQPTGIVRLFGPLSVRFRDWMNADQRNANAAPKDDEASGTPVVAQSEEPSKEAGSDRS
jgi:branched-chain amino acid transport system permease protein